MDLAGQSSLPDVMSKAEYARYRGFQAPYISKCIRIGKLKSPALRDDGRIDRLAADEMLANQRDPSRALHSDDSNSDSGGSFANEKAKSESLRRELLQIEIDEARGRLILKADVEQAAFDAGRHLRDNLLGLGNRLAGELAAMTEGVEIAAKLEHEFRELLNAFERDFSGAGAPEE